MMLGEDMLFGLYFKLNGLIQTVPRSEVAATLALVVHAAPGSILVYVTDNLPFHDNFLKGEEVAHTLTNYDLYVPLHRIIREKQIVFTVRWMPSHLSDPVKSKGKTRPDWVTDMHIWGNDTADILADIAARYAQVSLRNQVRVKSATYLVRRIQNRLATVVCHLPHRVKGVREPKAVVPRTPLTQLIAASQHDLVLNNGTWKCMACHSVFTSENKKFKEFISTECVPPKAVSGDFAFKGTININGQSSHSTHSLRIYRGIFYCVKCGGLGHKKLDLLAGHCSTVKEHGSRVIAKIGLGLLPPGISAWPSEEVPNLSPVDKRASSDSVYRLVEHYRDRKRRRLEGIGTSTR